MEKKRRMTRGGNPFEEKVWEYMQRQGMLSPGDRVVLGVSGGGDSMALLHLLQSLRERGEFQIAALHVNHGLRGEEADRDQRLVEAYCRERGISEKSVFVDVKALAGREKRGEEEAGRQARRRALSLYAKEWGGNKIALAHHLNDLAETVVHHLARGGGLRGLGGMAPVSGQVIRPFLSIEKGEIDQYLKEEGIPWAQDVTNFSDDYTRNRIRRHLLEDLKEQVNPRAVFHIGEAAAVAREADGYLSAQGAAHLQAFCKETKEGLLLEEDFFAAPRILRVYGILEGISRLTKSRRDISREHLLQAAEFCGKPVGKRLSLPGGLRAVRTYEGVLLFLRGKDARPPDPKGRTEAALPVPGALFFGGGQVISRIFPYQGEEVIQKKYTKWFDYDKIDETLRIRFRRAGDFLTVTGEGRKKKLKDYLIHEKIPQRERDFLPLVCRGAEVLWIVGHRRGESAKVTEETRRVLEISYKGGHLSERAHSGIDQ